MTNNNTDSNLKTQLNNDYLDMDALVKLILAIAVAAMPFFLASKLSFVILSLYILIMTLLSRIKMRTLLISTASYCIIVLIPFLFGLLMSTFLYSLTNNESLAFQQGNYEVFLRLFRLFIIWYVSILYFHTTLLKDVIGLFDKLLYPLKLVGVPVKDYLKVVMCIVMNLKNTGTEMKDSFVQNARSAVGGKGSSLNTKIKGLSQVIVSLIVNSFQKLDETQKIIENINPDDLFAYRFKATNKDLAALFGFILVTAIVIIAETL